jgi:hypothetical protein
MSPRPSPSEGFQVAGAQFFGAEGVAFSFSAVSPKSGSFAAALQRMRGRCRQNFFAQRLCNWEWLMERPRASTWAQPRERPVAASPRLPPKRRRDHRKAASLFTGAGRDAGLQRRDADVKKSLRRRRTARSLICEHLRGLLYNAITRAQNHCSVIVLGQGRLHTSPSAPGGC